jgi:1,4-alpha-glucan branching enzyme
LVALGAGGATRLMLQRGAPPVASNAVVDASATGGVTVVRFTLRAPDASKVSLVGDFNAWDPTATRLEKHGETWTILVPVMPGRHQYGFVVDGTRWIADPAAPTTPDNEFGSPNSVLFVGS